MQEKEIVICEKTGRPMDKNTGLYMCEGVKKDRLTGEERPCRSYAYTKKNPNSRRCYAHGNHKNAKTNFQTGMDNPNFRHGKNSVAYKVVKYQDIYLKKLKDTSLLDGIDLVANMLMVVDVMRLELEEVPDLATIDNLIKLIKSEEYEECLGVLEEAKSSVKSRDKLFQFSDKAINALLNVRKIEESKMEQISTSSLAILISNFAQIIQKVLLHNLKDQNLVSACVNEIRYELSHQNLALNAGNSE